MTRPLQKGSHHYDTDPEQYPINKPVTKLEAEVQATGEAEYVGDIPARHDELHAAFVVTTQANCDVETVDPKPALEMDGVVEYIDHRNIPGKNTVTVTKKHQELLFTSNHVHYAGKCLQRCQ